MKHPSKNVTIVLAGFAMVLAKSVCAVALVKGWPADHFSEIAPHIGKGAYFALVGRQNIMHPHGFERPSRRHRPIKSTW